MCEPSHSIIQYPDNKSGNDDDLPFSGQMTIEQRLSAGLGARIMGMATKIKNWFHFSKIGSGHSDAITLSGRASLILPRSIFYEGHWWDRSFTFDYGGHLPNHFFDSEQALQAARKYHDESVMKNIKTFRRFFEQSVEKSGRGHLYIVRLLEDVMTREGRDKVFTKLRRVFGKTTTLDQLFGPESQDRTKSQATSVVMGFTRDRKLFLPHWAHDDKLWTPG